LGVFCGVFGAASERRVFLACWVLEASETVKLEVRSISSSGSIDDILLMSLLEALGVSGMASVVLFLFGLSERELLLGVDLGLVVGVGEVESVGNVASFLDLVLLEWGLKDFEACFGGVDLCCFPAVLSLSFLCLDGFGERFGGVVLCCFALPSFSLSSLDLERFKWGLDDFGGCLGGVVVCFFASSSLSLSFLDLERFKWGLDDFGVCLGGVVVCCFASSSLSLSFLYLEDVNGCLGGVAVCFALPSLSFLLVLGGCLGGVVLLSVCLDRLRVWGRRGEFPSSGVELFAAFPDL
jgi:hypothetical protein